MMTIYEHDCEERTELWRQKRDALPLKPYCHQLPAREQASWPALENYLLKRNLSSYLAKANHWYPSVDAGDNQLRIVMPATSSSPDNHFWQARLIQGAGNRYESPHGVQSGDAVIVVYPWMEHGQLYKEAVVVEGPMCALAAAETGRLGIALMGAKPPEARLELTTKLVRGTIMTYIIPDADALDCAVETFAYLANQGVQCRVLDPFPNKDFAEMSREARTSLLR